MKKDLQQANFARDVMEAIARSSLDALITINPEGEIVEFGNAAESLYGYTRAEVIGRPVADIVIPPELREAHNNGMSHYNKTGEGPVLNNRVEVPSIKRDGSRFDAELTVVPFEIDSATYFTAFIRDISERKAYEEELKSAKELADRASEAKSRFVAHMSHELRSPLNAVLGAIDLIMDTPLAENQRNYARTIHSAGHTLLRLIEEVLDFSRIESDQLVLKEKEVKLHSFVHELALAACAKIKDGGPGLMTVTDPSLPQVVKFDSLRVRQIVSNLLDNAIKFTESGGIVLRALLATNEDQQLRIRFSVQDTGPGISDKQRDSIFREFVQGEGASQSAQDGVGLGLAISSLLAKKMQGQLGLESRPGEGSTFWVELPVEADDHRPTARHDYRGTAVVCCSESTVSRAYAEQLALLGFGVHEIESVDALEPLLQEADLLICDQDGAQLPDDIAEKILSDHHFPAQRFISLSSEGTATNQALNGFGVNLTKPFSFRLFEAAISGAELSTNLPARRESSPQKAQAEPASFHILLVEDSETNQMVASATLAALGHSVTIAENGQVALEKLSTEAFDGVLMDLRMPVMDGIEATRRIRESEESWAQVPIVALTANAVPSELERCIEVGMNSHLTKPMERAKLQQAIENHFGTEGHLS